MVSHKPLITSESFWEAFVLCASQVSALPFVLESPSFQVSSPTLPQSWGVSAVLFVLESLSCQVSALPFSCWNLFLLFLSCSNLLLLTKVSAFPFVVESASWQVSAVWSLLLLRFLLFLSCWNLVLLVLHLWWNLLLVRLLS